MKHSNLQKRFNHRHVGTDIGGHDFKSLKPRGEGFDTQATVSRLDVLYVDEPLLIASQHVAYQLSLA